MRWEEKIFNIMKTKKRKLFESGETSQPIDFTKFFNAFKKSASILLIFLFILTPLTPAFAQEAILDNLTTNPTTEDNTPLPGVAPTNEIPSSDIPTEQDSISETIDSTAGPNPNVDTVVVPQASNPEDVKEILPEETVPLGEEASLSDEEGLETEDPPQGLMDSGEGYDGPVDPKANEVGQRLARTDEHTGALVTNVPIVLPPGRNGMQPNLALSYNSQNQEDGSPFGYGWTLNIPYIERVNKMGTEKLYSTTSPVFFSSSLDGELATTTATTTYISRVDYGDMRSYTFSNNQWTVVDKSGTQYKFGHASSTQQTSTSSATQIYKWMLEEVRDKNDNFIKYTYYKDSGQIYPDTIYYTGTSTVNGIFKVEFLRESRIDAFPSFKTGFSVKSLYRIYQIKVYVNNDVVRKYDLTYTAGNNTVRSLLNVVQESGYVEGSSTPQSLPSTTFTYQTSNEGFATDASRSFPSDAKLNFEWGDKLADVNGDGLVDYMSSYTHNGQQTYQKVYLQKPDGTWATSTTYTIPFVFYYTTWLSFHYTYLLIVDVNADGRIDLVHEDGSVYINNGSNWVEDVNWNTPVYLSDPYPPHTDDVNGDGLPDLVAKNNSAVFLNTGTTWESATSTVFSAPSTTEFFTDINNDTLTDSLILTSSPSIALSNGIGVWVNTTSTPTSSLPGLTIPLDIDGDGMADLFESSVDSGVAHRDAYQGTGQSWNQKTNWIQTDVNLRYNIQPTVDRALDWNGDGLPDFSVGGAARINQNKKADLLTKIDYPTGGFSAITYKPSTQYSTSNVLDNPSLPLIVYTAQKIESNDGTSTSTSDTYVYKGGNYYFNNPWDKKFAGFEQIVKTDAAGNVTKTFFHTASSTDSSHGEYLDNLWKIGKPYRVEKYDNNSNLVKKTINKWDVATSTQAAGFVKLAQSVVFDYGSSTTPKSMAETYTYDNSTGNLTQKVEYGEVTGSDDGTFSDTGTDDFTTTYTYATSSTTTVMSLLASDSTVDHSSNKAKESRYYYDNLALRIVNLGNLTKREDWKVSSTYIDTEKTYNSYGLVVTEKDPRDKTTTYSYDTNNLYPTRVTNPVSHVSTYSYDYSSGKVATSTDPNGNIFVNVYDGLDRVLKQKQPDPAATSTLLTATDFTYTDIARAMSVKKSNYLDSATTTDSYIYLDGLGRKIQERKEATSTYFSVKDFVYNNRGLLLKETLPYFSSGSGTTTATSTTALYTTYVYDALQRVTATNNAISTSTNSYSNWKTTTTDLRGKVKHYYRDAYNNLIKVEEENFAASSSTPSELYSNSLYNDANLVAYYRLEDSADSKGSYTLSANGSPSSVSAKFNNGYSYSASPYHNTGSNLGIIGGAVTISGWVKINANPSSGSTWYLASQFNSSAKVGYDFWYGNSGGTYTFSVNRGKSGVSDNPVSVAGDLGTSVYHHVVLTYDGTSLKGYLDGNLFGTLSTSGNGSGGSVNDFVIGCAYNGTSCGNISWDDMAVFSRALSATEVTSLYSAGYSTYIYTTNYAYNYLGNLTNITDASGNVRNFTYDGLGRRLTAQDLHATGDSTYGTYTYTYDDAGNLTSKVDAKNQTINYTYDNINRPLTEDYTGQAGTEITNTYDTCTQGRGRMCTASSSAVTLTNTYNALGQLTQEVKVISGNSYTSTYTYDRQGNQLILTNPDNSQVKYIYDSAGMVDRVQRKESTDGSYTDVVSSIDYNPLGQETVITFVNGAITTNTYDDSKLYRLVRKVTTIPQAEGLMGEIPDFSEIIDELPAPETSTSTPSSTSTEDSLASSSPLSLNSESPGFFASLWQTVTNGFDRVISRIVKTGSYIASLFTVKTAMAAAIELYSTDLFNDANLTAYYRMENTNDSKNSYHLTAVSSPSSVSAKFNNGYSYGGSPYHHTNSNLGINGGAVTISGWVKINANPSSGTTWYIASQFNSTSDVEYDIWYGNSGGTYTLSVNRGKSGVSDNPVSVAGDLGTSVYHHVVLTYDGTTLTGYLDGSSFGTSGTSGNGSGGSVNDFVIGCAYNGTSCGNITWDDIAVFNRALTSGEVSDLYNGDTPTPTTVIQDLTYTYDNNGNITEIADDSETHTSKTTNYTYDDLNRLTAASTTLASFGSNYNQTYTYDAIGNITSKSDQGTYTYAGNGYTNPHAVTSIGTATSTYDNNGNLLAIKTNNATTTLYTWDYNNLLIRASSTTSGFRATSTYDSFGQRAKYVTGTSSQTTTYYPSKGYNITGSTPTKHIFLPNGTMIATIVGTGTSTTVSYIHTEHLGGTNVVTNSAGDAVTQLLDYYPYGTRRLNEGTDVSQREFTGHEYDETEDLVYMGARYYNANIGKFITQDPVFWDFDYSRLTDPQIFNSYTYARNNPITYTDPDGRDAVLKFDEKNKTIIISSTIYIYGEGATQDVANRMQKDISEVWDTGWTYTDEKTNTKYSVKFEVEVRVTKHSWTHGYRNDSNVIQVGGVDRSYVDAKKAKKGAWRENEPDPAPHEFGHLLGLDDRYSDEGGSDEGWEGNIMAEPAMEGKVEQKNIDSIIKPYAESHNNRWFPKWNKSTTHHVAPRNGNFR